MNKFFALAFAVFTVISQSAYAGELVRSTRYLDGNLQDLEHTGQSKVWYQKWYALHETNGAWKLTQAKVKLTRIPDESTIEVTSKIPDVEFFLRGREFSPGVVQAVEKRQYVISSEDKSTVRDNFSCRPELKATEIALKLNSSTYRLSCKLIGTRAWEVYLVHGKSKQRLAGRSYDGWRISWAGNLDRDKRLDLIVEESFQGGACDIVLLSSKAMAGELVRSAGERCAEC